MCAPISCEDYSRESLDLFCKEPEDDEVDIDDSDPNSDLQDVCFCCSWKEYKSCAITNSSVIETVRNVLAEEGLSAFESNDIEEQIYQMYEEQCTRSLISEAIEVSHLTHSFLALGLTSLTCDSFYSTSGCNRRNQ